MVLRPTFAFLVSVMNFYYGSRRSAASSSTTPAATPAKDDFPEALTYRYNDNSAWVPAARTHEASIFFFPLTSRCLPVLSKNKKNLERANNHRFLFLGRFRLAFFGFLLFFVESRRRSTWPNTRTRSCGTSGAIASRSTRRASRASRASRPRRGSSSCGGCRRTTSWTCGSGIPSSRRAARRAATPTRRCCRSTTRTWRRRTRSRGKRRRGGRTSRRRRISSNCNNNKPALRMAEGGCAA